MSVVTASGRGVVGTAALASAHVHRLVLARGRAAVVTASTARAMRVRSAVPIGQYSRLLRSLLPPGQAWSAPAGSVLADVLTRASLELARIDGRIGTLMAESDPRTADELLTDWERLLGLAATGTTEDRRAAVIARLTGRGRQSREFYRQLAATLGYEIEITEHRPFVAGSRAGAALTNGGWIYAWHVHTRSGERDELLEATLREHLPSHTLLRVYFSEA